MLRACQRQRRDVSVRVCVACVRVDKRNGETQAGNRQEPIERPSWIRQTLNNMRGTVDYVST